MRAIAIQPSRREVGIIQRAEPVLASPTDVRVRILEVGVCGTDREICAFEYGTPPPGDAHLILGHESLGEVIEVGQQVHGLSPGDLVVPMVRRPCAHVHCVACRAGRQDFCYTGDYTERGINQAHGFMTEQIVDDARFMNPLPRHLREVGVLTEPLTIAEKAMAQVWNVQARLPWGCPVPENGHRHLGQARCHRALVLGAGPVGLLGAMTLVHAGFETFVYARESAPSLRTDVLAQIGATYVSAADLDLAGVAARIGNIDLVFEATGASRLAFEALAFLGTNGIFVLTGVPGRRGPVAIDTDLVMRNLVLKNQVLIGTVNAGREDFAAAIRDLDAFEQRWPGALGRLITGRHPIDRATALLCEAPGGIKEVVDLALAGS
jgi:threonine dehydrogenase-like Zn-dependent dehydrogenase